MNFKLQVEGIRNLDIELKNNYININFLKTQKKVTKLSFFTVQKISHLIVSKTITTSKRLPRKWKLTNENHVRNLQGLSYY